MIVCKDRAKGRPLGRLWQWSSKGGMDGGLGQDDSGEDVRERDGRGWGGQAAVSGSPASPSILRAAQQLLSFRGSGAGPQLWHGVHPRPWTKADSWMNQASRR